MTVTDIRPSRPAPISGNALILIAAFTALTFALAWMDEPPGVLTFAFVAVGWILSVWSTSSPTPMWPTRPATIRSSRRAT